MSVIVGGIDSQVESMCHVTNGAVGRGAHGGRSPLWNILFQLFLCHMSKEVTRPMVP
jgi:hypothetical protein